MLPPPAETAKLLSMAPAGPGLKVNDDKILRPFYSNSNNTLYNSAYFHTSSNELSVSIWDLGKINETRQPDDLPPTEHSERDTIQKTLLVKITLNGQLASRDRQLDRVHPTLRERDLFVSMETHALTHARIRSTLTRSPRNTFSRRFRISTREKLRRKRGTGNRKKVPANSIEIRSFSFWDKLGNFFFRRFDFLYCPRPLTIIDATQGDRIFRHGSSSTRQILQDRKIDREEKKRLTRNLR